MVQVLCLSNNVCTFRSGRKLISGSSDETVKIWDYENSTCVSTIKLDGFIPSVNVHPFNENLIFASTSTKQLNVFASFNLQFYNLDY